MKIVETEKKYYELTFDDALFPDCGFAFPCDAQGNILWGQVSDPGKTKEALAYCKEHPDDWTPRTRDGRVVQIVRRVRYGICPICGHKVYLGGSGGAAYPGVVECECGQWYNVFGQAIKPPKEWEEDFFGKIWP